MRKTTGKRRFYGEQWCSALQQYAEQQTILATLIDSLPIEEYVTTHGVVEASLALQGLDKVISRLKGKELTVLAVGQENMQWSGQFGGIVQQGQDQDGWRMFAVKLMTDGTSNMMTFGAAHYLKSEDILFFDRKIDLQTSVEYPIRFLEDNIS